MSTTSAGSDSVTQRRAIVHIGTHKTGTTSFQGWANRHREELVARARIHYYAGRFAPSHYELPILCLRTNRNMPMRSSRPDWCLEEWQAEVRAHILQQVEHPVDTLLCSAEGLSYLRHADEVERLVELLQPRQISAVVVLREPMAFLRSYAGEMARQGFPPSPYRESFAYVEEDSWLVRYEELLEVYTTVLGEGSLQVVSYEESLQVDGSIIPAILRACGADPAGLPSWEDVWQNGPATKSRTTRTKQLARNARSALHRLTR